MQYWCFSDIPINGIGQLFWCILHEMVIFVLPLGPARPFARTTTSNTHRVRINPEEWAALIFQPSTIKSHQIQKYQSSDLCLPALCPPVQVFYYWVQFFRNSGLNWSPMLMCQWVSSHIQGPAPRKTWSIWHHWVLSSYTVQEFLETEWFCRSLNGKCIFCTSASTFVLNVNLVFKASVRCATGRLLISSSKRLTCGSFSQACARKTNGMNFAEPQTDMSAMVWSCPIM